MDAHRANVSRLVATWRAWGLEVLQPATASELRGLEERLASPWSEDLRVYLEVAGGLAAADFDAESSCWWPVQRVVPLMECLPRLADARGFLVVADMLAECTLYAVQHEVDAASPRGTVIETDGVQ